MGPFKCYATQWGRGCGNVPEKSITKVYVWFKGISISRGWVGVKFQKKHYVIHEWPLWTLQVYSEFVRKSASWFQVKISATPKMFSNRNIIYSCVYSESNEPQIKSWRWGIIQYLYRSLCLILGAYMNSVNFITDIQKAINNIPYVTETIDLASQNDYHFDRQHSIKMNRYN